jgi:dsDNA-specific endonuclease/ATPase MutS2
LKKLAEKAEKARLELEKAAAEARKEAETLIPSIKSEMEAIDKQIAELQQRKSALVEQLKLLGEKVRVKGVGVRAREGGMADRFKEFMRQVGVGATVSTKDIQEYLGSASGYVGMIIKAQVEAGNLERVGAGQFKVLAVP